mmetsp:Transcript_44767/g.143390  ORF Transcript_44767/g.143390 Transcript_44767/m.143390 type:complete len:342 (+) Transcript_44767:1132-2157(+)
MLEAALREVLDRLARVVHSQHHAAPRRGLECVGHHLLGGPVVRNERDLEGTRAFGDQLCGLILVAVRMAADDDRLLPAGHEARDVGADDRGMEHRAIQNVADRAIRTWPHLPQVELKDPSPVWRDRRALDADVVPDDGVGGIAGHLVIGLISVGDAQVVVVDLHVKKREYQLLLDHLPQHACHLVAIKLDYRIVHLYLLKGHPGLNGPDVRRAALLLQELGKWSLQKLPQLNDERLVASNPFSELPQRHLLAPDLGHDLRNHQWHFGVGVLRIPEAGVVQHPHGVRELGAGDEVVLVGVDHGEDGLQLLLRPVGVARQQHKCAHLGVPDLAKRLIGVEDAK